MSVRERVRAGRRSAAADTTVGRRRRRSDRRLVVVAIVGVIALVAAGGIAAVSTEHLVVPVPVTETILGSVACPSTDRCIAVGSIGSRYTIRVPFAVHSAGSWEVRSPAPPIDNGNSFLLSLSCAGDGRCVSVGSQEVPAPYFGAKSGGNRPLVETWNGRTWRPEKVPIPAGTADAELSGVDCVPSACMAVGTVSNRSGTGRVLTEWWNGSTWKLILPPRPRTMEDPSLAAVSCTSPASCTGVGQYTFDLGFGTLITPLILRWNGRQWRFQQSGRLGQAQDTMLNAVDCPTDTVCVTVGSERTAAGTYRSIAEIRHGDTWRLTPTTDPPHTPDADLVAVDCTGPTACPSAIGRRAGSMLRPRWA